MFSLKFGTQFILFLLFCWYLFVNILSLFYAMQFLLLFLQRTRGLRGKDYTFCYLFKVMLCFTGVSVCWNYNRSGDQVLFLLYSFVFLTCVSVCDSVSVCKNVCVLNNYVTTYFSSNIIRVKNLAWVGRWQTGNSSKVGQKLGRPLNYYDELSSHVIFFCSLLRFLSFSSMIFFNSHISNALGLVIWTKMLTFSQ